MGNTVDIGPLAEFAEGSVNGRTLPGGTRIALYRVDGVIYATDDLCTHGQSSLSEEGTLTGRTIECAWHFGTFDVTTGEACAMPCVTALRTYPVTVVEGRVHVQV